MDRRASAVTALTLAVAGSLAAAAPAVHNDPDPRLDLRVSGHGRTVRATAGSSCLPYGTRGLCRDAAYPLETRGAIPVHARSPGGAPGTVDIRIGAAASELSAALLRVRGGRIERLTASEPAERLGTSGRRWRAELGRRTSSATVRDVFVRYSGGGDADFWAGVRPHRHARR